MKIVFKEKLNTRIRLKVLFATASLLLILSGIFIILLNTGANTNAVATTTTKYIIPGSFVINMGVTPQTYDNGLKPYGLVYDLIINHQVPVIWAIEPTKVKDGIDFVNDGITYRGGPFIIEAGYIDSTVSAVIASWQSFGVVGNYVINPVTVPVNQILTSYPKIMIDTTSSLQAILIAYFNNALIPSPAYDLGSPSYLTSCHDVWANPHGDPVWSSHSYLYNFVTVQKSWIWAQCHSVSMMEGCKSSTLPLKQLNFLSSNGFKCWGSNKCNGIPETHAKSMSAPFTYYYPADPFMQFMGTMHSACTAGSEQWFQPLSTGSWRSTTRRGVTTGSGIAPNEGTVLVYGPAYGDSTNGWVMYEGGHSLDSGGNSLADKIAGQRAFLNFLFRAGVSRQLNITASLAGWLAAGQTATATATVTGGSPPFTYQWTSAQGGTFSSPNSGVTQYTAPEVDTLTTDILRVIVTDNCGRKNFATLIVHVDSVETLPVSLLQFKGESKKNSVILRWETGSEVNNDFFTISKSPDGIKFGMIGILKGKGTTSENTKYSFIDNDPYEDAGFYQLSQTDYDGNTETFPPIFLRSKQKRSVDLILFPNPFDKKLSLVIESEDNMQATIQLYSSTGIRIFEKQYKVRSGSNSILIDTEKFSPGSYYLSMFNSNGEDKISKKIFKK
jgi:hypothetical protein